MEIELVAQDGTKITLVGVPSGVNLQVVNTDGTKSHADLFIYEVERLSRSLMILADRQP